MGASEIFRNLSPLDHRYYLSNKQLFDSLRTYLSEEATILYCARAEIALLETHIHFLFDDRKDLAKKMENIESLITPEEVYEEEEKTNHNIRALVNVIKRK